MNNLRHLSMLITSLLLCFYLSGCETLNSAVMESIAQEPNLKVEGLTVTNINLEAVSLGLKLKVDNPNSFALALSGYTYALAFNGQQLFDGKAEQGFKVAAKDSGVIEVPLTIGFKQAMALVNSTAAGEPLKYNVKADMKLAAPVLNKLNLSADKEGQIDIPQLPDVQMGQLKVEKFSFTDVLFNLSMKIANPNGFGLNLKDIGYDLSFADKKVVSGALEDNIEVAQNQATEINIPIKVALSSLGGGLLNAIRKGTFSDYSLDANFTLDSGFPALQNLKVPVHYSPSAGLQLRQQ